MNCFRLAPVTAESIVICVAIFSCCLFQSVTNRENFYDVQRDWGAIVLLEKPSIYEGAPREKEPELYGLFDLWGGDWWRIPATSFHHANLLHLVVCLGAAWYLGQRLEQYWGSLVMVWFLIPSFCVPVMAEVCGGNPVMGLSGTICAMLGAAVVLRSMDDKFAGNFSDEATKIGLIIIILSVVATMVEIVSFPITAHFAGLAYGAVIAWLAVRPSRNRSLLIAGIILAHLWIFPGLYLVSHPVWIGRYHWYQAASSRNVKSVEESLVKAVTVDPSLTGAWMYWSRFAEERGEVTEAWRRAVNGLANNPTSVTLIDGTRRLWRHLDANQRLEAERVLVELFGHRSSLWLEQIRASKSFGYFDSVDDESHLSEVINLKEFALDQKFDLQLIDLSPRVVNSPEPINPILPNIAVEGETL